jgi:hypothetical protein
MCILKGHSCYWDKQGDRGAKQILYYCKLWDIRPPTTVLLNVFILHEFNTFKRWGSRVNSVSCEVKADDLSSQMENCK